MAYVDVYHKLMTDQTAFREVFSTISKLQSLEKKGICSPVDRTRTSMELLRHYNYNIGLLFPYMFPTYINGKQLSLIDRPFGFAMTDLTPGSIITTRAGRQAAKSTTIGGRMLTAAHMLPLRQMYIAPHTDQVKTFSRRLREMERFARFQVNSSKYKQNDYYKEYPTGAVVELYRVYTDAVGIRGKTTDNINLDEAQNFDGSLLPEVHQVMKASRWPIFNVSGTSLTIDTFLEDYYQNGSRGTWHIPLPCRKKTGERLYLDCGDREQVLGAIKEQGLSCPYTGKLIDPRTGSFVHELPSRLEKNRPSLHIPQVIIPDYVIDPTKWVEIWDAFREYDHKKFLQEIMGIPTALGARELTEQELRDICVLGSIDKVQGRVRKGRDYKYVISGCDWGGSDYNRALNIKQSYTVHAMIGVRFDGKVDILHMRKYSGMDYKEIAFDILADHRRLRGQFMASDYGVGRAYNMLLREPGAIPIDRHLVFSYTGPKTAPVAVPAGDHMINQYSLNKTESMTELFKAVKTQRLRCYDWEQAKPELNDFLNVMRAQRESDLTGDTSFRYIKAGDRPDDTLHAVNFAFVLARLILGEPLIGDRVQAYELRNMLQGGDRGALTIPDPVSG